MIISSIILIGPMRTGKSTLAEQLSKDLTLPRVSLDDLRWTYYPEIGFDVAYDRALAADGAWEQRRRYRSKHDPHAIKRVLEEYGSNHVIDFGGSHSLHEDAAQLATVQALLQPYPHVVLVLPHPDPVEALRILDIRRGERHLLYGFDLNERMLRHPSNYTLAKHILYTAGKTVAESSQDTQHLLGL